MNAVLGMPAVAETVLVVVTVITLALVGIPAYSSDAASATRLGSRFHRMGVPAASPRLRSASALRLAG